MCLVLSILGVVGFLLGATRISVPVRFRPQPPATTFCLVLTSIAVILCKSSIAYDVGLFGRATDRHTTVRHTTVRHSRDGQAREGDLQMEIRYYEQL